MRVEKKRTRERVILIMFLGEIYLGGQENNLI